MHTFRVTALLAGLAVVSACNGGAPAPADRSVKVEAEAKVEAPKVAAADKHEGDKHEAEEGCIYADAHKKEHDEADCPHGGGGHGAAAGSGEPGHFGAAFALKESRSLSQVLAAGKDALPKDAVQVTGTIDNVCQKKGCWMVVKDGEVHARVLMKDHGFTVPMDTKGKPVVVEGTLEARTFTEAQVKHLEKDAGGDPAKVSGEQTEFVLTASGIKIAANS